MRSSVQSCFISEESYCAPWDLKIQEEKFKRLNDLRQSTKPPVLPPLPPGGLMSTCYCHSNNYIEKIESQPKHAHDRNRLNSLPLTKIPTTRQSCSSPTFRFISSYQDIDDTINLPINRYYWYHHTMSRRQAEQTLESRPAGSFLVRQSESGHPNDYSLSIKTGKGCLHMRISFSEGFYILGECSRPFASVPLMIKYFSQTSVPIRGAAHIKLTSPILRWEILSSSLSNEELL